jgi:hypothetical protein
MSFRILPQNNGEDRLKMVKVTIKVQKLRSQRANKEKVQKLEKRMACFYNSLISY